MTGTTHSPTRPRARRTDRMRRRLFAHHLPLAGASVAAIVLVASLVHQPTTVARLSMATAYVALALLVVTMALGPWRVLTRRPVALSLDARRDLGIWAAIVGLLHVAVGLFVHLGNPLHYFFREGTWVPRADAFGFTNDVGLACTVILLVLLGTSNDASVRRLGAQRWKHLHRYAYLLAALVVTHGVVYQLLERRTAGFVAAFAALAVTLTLMQLAGFMARRSPAAAAPRHDDGEAPRP